MTDEFDAVFDEDHAAQYDAQFEALAPVKDALHLAMDIALHDRCALPEDARVLSVGAGTGQEVLALATRHPKWQFVAVDPSAPMLERCRSKARELGVLDRCALHVGTLDTLPPQPPFHAATSILVSHFMTETEARTRFFSDIRKRLAAGGALFNADLTSEESPQGPATGTLPTREAMLAFWGRALARAMPAEKVADILSVYGREVAVSTSAEVHGLLRDAGFSSTLGLYQFGMIRAWLARSQASP